MASPLRSSPSGGGGRAKATLGPALLIELLAMAALAGVAGWIAVVDLQQDFAAYFTAGHARASGLDPYRNYLATPGGPWDGVAVYRHSRFLYPPLVAELFRPLAALPFPWAKALFTAASVVGLWLGLRLTEPARREGRAVDDGHRLTRRLAEPARHEGLAPGDGRRLTRGAFVFAAAALWPPVLAALERGQIDLILLPLFALAWRRRAEPLVAGAALAAGALCKPFALVVLPLLVCARQWRLAAAALGVTALFGGLGVVCAGPALSRAYVREVLPRATLYGEGGPEAWLLPDADLARAGEGRAEGTAQIDGRGRVFADEIGTFRRNSSLVRWLSADAAPSPAASLSVLLVLGAGLAVVARRRPESGGWYWGALLAGVLAAPVSWAMSLPLALPLFLAAAEAFATPPTSEEPPAFGKPSALGTPQAFRSWRWPLVVAMAVAYGAGFVGPIAPVAWCAAALAGIATGVLLPARAMAAP